MIKNDDEEENVRELTEAGNKKEKQLSEEDSVQYEEDFFEEEDLTYCPEGEKIEKMVTQI
jgi:hypothetical protein